MEPPPTDANKRHLLNNYISPEVFDIISDCANYTEALALLQATYVKQKNEIFARHKLRTCKQEPGQNIDQFMLHLKTLGKDCNFVATTAAESRDFALRDALIDGLLSPNIRQRLLENNTLTLEEAYKQARSLEQAHLHSTSYTDTQFSAAINSTTEPTREDEPALSAAITQNHQKPPASKTCLYCGNYAHHRSRCPARLASCHDCGKRGHFSKVCLSKRAPAENTASKLSSASANYSPTLSSIHDTTKDGLSKATEEILVNGAPVEALFDTGSTENFVDYKLVSSYSLKVFPATGSVSMAASALTSEILGYCTVNIVIRKRTYRDIKLIVMKNLCKPVIMGLSFMKEHKSFTINFGGSQVGMSVCGLASAHVDPPSLFNNLNVGCKPIATKSRLFSISDKEFIRTEVRKLYADGVIEHSSSPWRSQVLVTSEGTHKRRMVVDYSQTINKFTELDAYPLPRTRDIANSLTQYQFFSTYDLKSAYHQIPIKEEDKIFTAFEADGQLYQFCRMPFGLTNAVACFQRLMNQFIDKYSLSDTFAYLDNITVGGRTQEEHDTNVKRFLEMIHELGLTLNHDKTVSSVREVNLLGYCISYGQLKPDPERLKPLLDLPEPTDSASLKRILGMFSYYSNWIYQFSKKIEPLTKTECFPLSTDARKSFIELKQDIANSVLCSINEEDPFVIETDASDHAIAATLSQKGRPVAFFTRTLNHSERKHSSIEKEAYAIIEAIRKWRHYVGTRHFTLITDQKSVA